MAQTPKESVLRSGSIRRLVGYGLGVVIVVAIWRPLSHAYDSVFGDTSVTFSGDCRGLPPVQVGTEFFTPSWRTKDIKETSGNLVVYWDTTPPVIGTISGRQDIYLDADCDAKMISGAGIKLFVPAETKRDEPKSLASLLRERPW